MTDTKPTYSEIATSGDGRDITEPWIAELRDYQDEVLRSLGGDLIVYERVLRDDQVMACWQQRRRAVVSCEWKVDPGGSRRADRKAADFIRELLPRIRWDRVTEMMLSGIYYGWSVSEVLWAPDGGLITVENIKVRNARRFRWDRDGNLRLLTPTSMLGETMPSRKFWTMVAGSDNDDDVYGRGLAHWLYWPVWFKRNFMRFWAIWAEKYAAPTAKGTVPTGTDHAERRKLLGALRAIRQDSAIVVPEGTQVELLQAAKDSGGSYDRLVELMNQAISKVVLSQTMTTDDGSSLAQAEVHEGVQRRVIKADADIICASAGDSWIRWLVEWNFPGAAIPVTWRETEPPADLRQRAERDQVIYGLGYRPTEDYVRETYGEGFEPRPDAGGAGETPALPDPADTPGADPADSVRGWLGRPDQPQALAEPSRRRARRRERRARRATALLSLAEDGDEPAGDRYDRLAEALAREADAAFEATIDALRSALDQADALATALPVEPPDATPVAEVYRAAFLLAYLIGYMEEDEPADSADDPLQFAAALPAPPWGAAVPFREAIDYFRQKINVPTERWTDLYQAAHARGFMVAGAQSQALLEDMRKAVDMAIARGASLGDFRKEFDTVVHFHGWSYRGTRKWRTGVIYDTNLRMARSAGRWAQIQRLKAVRPYLSYRHTPQERPRPAHVRLHGVTRPVDDPWWGLYWPPNGWHCKCWAESLGPEAVATPPREIKWKRRVVRAHDYRRQVMAPEGIEPGFAYNPGQAWDLARQHPMATPQQLGGLAAEHAARQRVADYARRTGREYLEAIDRDTGHHLAARAGTATRADAAGQPLLAEAMREDVRIALIHGHPNDTPLSPQDIYQLSAPGIDMVDAVGPGGSLYSIARGPAWSAGAAPRILDAAVDSIRRTLAARIDPATMRQPQRVTVFGAALSRVLSERGVIRATTRLPDGVDLTPWESDIQAAVQSAAEALGTLGFATMSATADLPYGGQILGGPMWGTPAEWTAFLADLDDVPRCRELAQLVGWSGAELAAERQAGRSDPAELDAWGAILQRLQDRLDQTVP